MRVAHQVAVTDTGRKRRHNEDSYVVRPPLFAVADGMGGAQAGEIASRLAVEAMAGESPGDGEQQVATLIQEANRRVYERSAESAEMSGMGTTMTAALVAADGRVAIGHVGDSRAYLLRGGRLEQLTDDHSLVAELVRTGKLSLEEAETHPQRSVITRALGTDPDVDVDTFSIDSQSGDLFLLCSDGLTSMVADEEIQETIAANRDDLEAAARALVRQANRRGGEDNITVLFFELGEEPAAVDDTARLPAVAAPAEPDGEDEDTLDEADRVPAVDTMVVPPEQVREAFAAAPEPAAGDASDLDATARRVLATLALVALVALAVALLVWGLSR